MMQKTAFAPVNVAAIKYWGKIDEVKRLPTNNSLSVNLTNLGTTTTVEWVKGLKKDVADKRMVKQLDRIRQLKGFNLKARVTTKNNFPSSTGLSSSASGLAALTLAATAACGLKLSQKDLSRLSRLGSGSACRSIPDGWVEWRKGNDQTSYAQTVFPPNYWNLTVLVVILSYKPKEISSSQGHQAALKSPFFKARLVQTAKDLKAIKKAIKKKDFDSFGNIMERECLSLHAVMLTGQPSLIYWLPQTVRLMRAVRQWREEGLKSYFTVNTGQNAFVFCQKKDEQKLIKKLKGLKGVLEVRKDQIGPGARLLA